jgi:hypothetical protein
MKEEVKKVLKEQGKEFSESIYELSKQLMKMAGEKQPALKEYLNISPDFKVDWITGNWDKIKEIAVK